MSSWGQFPALILEIRSITHSNPSRIQDNPCPHDLELYHLGEIPREVLVLPTSSSLSVIGLVSSAFPHVTHLVFRSNFHHCTSMPVRPNAALVYLPLECNSRLMIISCTTCRSRKVACDRRKPKCGFCTSNQFECEYAAARRPGVRAGYISKLDRRLGMFSFSSVSCLVMRKPNSLTSGT